MIRCRKKSDILEKAAPDLFGNKQTETKKNYVIFWVPYEVHKRVREWLDNGDGKYLMVGTVNQNKELRVCIVNEREQRLYEARGYKDN